MKVVTKSLRVSVIGVLFLLLVAQVDTTSGSPNQAAVLLEIVYSCCGGWEYEEVTTRVYTNGHYVRKEVFNEKAKSGRARKVIHKVEKDLETGELAEGLGWASSLDFLSADPEYVVTIVREFPDWITITYRDKQREKKVKVFNFSRGNPAEKAKVPPSFLKLARWADPYSSLFN